MNSIQNLIKDADLKSRTVKDKEVYWDKSLTIVSKTDLFGSIEYVNSAFADVSGYDEHELIGKPHNIIRHPDMPEVIFKILWDNIKKGHKFHGIIKNLTKSGEYYWVITDFDYVINDDAKILNYIARRKAVSEGVVKKTEFLYKKLLKIEEVSGIKASEKYLTGFLEEQYLTFVQYVTKLMIDDANEQKELQDIKDSNSPVEKEELRKGFFEKFFGL